MIYLESATKLAEEGPLVQDALAIGRHIREVAGGAADTEKRASMLQRLYIKLLKYAGSVKSRSEFK